MNDLLIAFIIPVSLNHGSHFPDYINIGVLKKTLSHRIILYRLTFNLILIKIITYLFQGVMLRKIYHQKPVSRNISQKQLSITGNTDFPGVNSLYRTPFPHNMVTLCSNQLSLRIQSKITITGISYSFRGLDYKKTTALQGKIKLSPGPGQATLLKISKALLHNHTGTYASQGCRSFPLLYSRN